MLIINILIINLKFNEVLINSIRQKRIKMFKITKKIFQLKLIVFLSLFVACDNSSEEQAQDRHVESIAQKTTSIKFESKEFDFGTITSGEHVSHRFKFKNTGSENLYINKVEASCGCTVVNYSKDAVLPDAESFIEIVFDSSNYHGLQIKNITVFANTKPEKTELVVAATVDIPEQ